MIYTAESRALACLENIVHRGSTDLRMPFLIKKILIPAEVTILELPPELLPEEWNKYGVEGYNVCRPFGNTWIKNSESAILKVPSAIVPGEFNYLINPGHEDFKLISIVSEEPFFFDERIEGDK